MADLYSGAAGTMTVVRSGAGGRKDGPRAEDMDVSGYTTGVVLRRLLNYVRPHLVLLVLSFVASAVSVVLQVYVPILVGHAIDAMVGQGSVDFVALRSQLARLAVVVPLAVATQWLSGYATNRLSCLTVRDLRDDVYGKVRRLPFSFLDSHPHGDLLSRMTNDTDAVGDGLLQGFTQLFGGIVTIVGTLGFMFYISVPVGLVVVLLTPVSMMAASLIARKSSKSFADAQRLQGGLSGYAEEMVSNQDLVAAFGRGDASAEEFGSINAELYVAGEHSQFVSSLSNPTTRLVNNITYAIVAVVGCVCVITGMPSPMTIGQVQSFLSYANQYMKPFNEISGVVTQLQAALASAQRIFALLDAPQEVQDHANVYRGTKDVRGEIAFEHVDFAYEEGRPILRDVSFKARPGERFALVGPTGCGKTTLINLLMRFYDAKGGTILLDGRDTLGIARSDLRSAFGMVLQDTWLVSGMVRQNIAYARPDATIEEVEVAAKQAHAHKFIRQLPQGYDTVIGEDGGSLSAGQKQLLCIARVMLADPPILLLDEATSSIDTRTELQVQDAFDRMMSGRTSLVVAHRLSTIRNADCILVMDAGRIVERGTHDELLAVNGAYAHLYESQFAGLE